MQGKSTIFHKRALAHHLYLHVYDGSGNHVGLNYATDEIELAIPGSYYFDDGNGTMVIVVPEIISLTILVDAEYAEDPVESYNLIVNLATDLGASSQTYLGTIVAGDKQTFVVETSENHFSLYLGANVDINPECININSNGQYATAYVEFPKGFTMSSINASSMLVNGTIPIDLSAPVAVGDYDLDGYPDLMVKFNKTQLASYIQAHVNMTKLAEDKFMTITLTITGKLDDGTLFRGSDQIKISLPSQTSTKGSKR